MNPDQVNLTRFKPGTPHYESFFQRANHPTRPLAFWIRYTLFNPKDEKEKSLGELWAIYFDGETGQHIAMKGEFPLRDCVFSHSQFRVRVGEATLEPGKLKGSAGSIQWDLTYSGDEKPLFLLPENLYEAKFPAAKSLVGLPLATYNGTLTVNGDTISIENWVGSQNHNWGRKHTDRYAWGQVAGFDNAPGSFLEVATAQLKFGPIMTPPMTLIVLRHNGQEIRMNSLGRAIRAKGKFTYFDWSFASEENGWRVEGHIHARHEDFVGLRYYNPPGGVKHCLNTKIAACELTITSPDGKNETLTTQNHAAFEILTDDTDHGVTLRV